MHALSFFYMYRVQTKQRLPAADRNRNILIRHGGEVAGIPHPKPQSYCVLPDDIPTSLLLQTC